jgi:hypothetical protein
MIHKNNTVNFDKNSNELASQSKWMLIVAFFSYIFFYALFYIRNTYFNGAQVMRFPVDLLAMSPAANDLWACVTKAGEIISTKKIIGVQNVYSPFSVIIFNLFSTFNFETVRIGSYYLTGISSIILLLYVPKQFKKSLWENNLGIFLISLTFLSYGLRFELERGQINEFVFLLALGGSFLAKSKKNFLVVLGFSMFVFATQMKVWPLVFIFCFFDRQISLLANVYRILIFGIVNFMLLFSMGYEFLKTYLGVITSSVQNQANVWIANMSLYAFKIQLVQASGLPVYLLSFISIIIIAVFFITLTFGLISKDCNIDLLLAYHCMVGGLLFPNISFDYKLNVFSLMTIIFYVCYDQRYRHSKIGTKYLNSGAIKFTINWHVLLERLFLLLPLVIFPITLFSYIYKANYGLLIASNTLPLIIVLFATSGLIFINITKSNQETHR